MPDRFALRDRISRTGTPETFESIENELERLWAALKRVNETAGDVDLSDFVAGPDPAESIDSEIMLWNGTSGRLAKRAVGTGVVHATDGVYSVGDVLISELDLDGDPTHVLFMDGTMRAIVKSDVTDFPHRLLSVEHSDTDPEVPEPGAIVVGTQGGEFADSETYWMDGGPAPIISSLDDPGEDVYWIDGEPLAGIGFSAEGLWAKLAQTTGDPTIPYFNGSAIEFINADLGTDAREYTPVWTAVTTNPAIGNGTLVGRYRQIGKLVYFYLKLTAGSTTTFGTGAWIFTMPPIAPLLTLSPFAAYAQFTGGTAPMGCTARTSSPATVFRILRNTTDAFLSAATVAWAAGDFVACSGVYEAA